MPEVLSALRRFRYGISAVADATLWVVCLLAASAARLNFDLDAIDRRDFLIVAGVAIVAQLSIGWMSGLYRGQRTIASFEEVIVLVATSSGAGLAALLTVAIAGPPNLLPVSAVLAATAYQMLGALGLRYAARLTSELRSRSRHLRSERLLVFGAGNAGTQIIRALQRDPATDLDPVGILDDDPTKRNLRIHGVPVVGNRQTLADEARRRDVHTLLIALPSATQSQINEIADAALAADLRVKILPSVRELTSGKVHVSDIRDIELADFLNRAEVTIDDTAVRSYLEDKRVLITGAGGSIGSELARRVRDFGPSRVVMLDRDENALHALQLSLEGRALLESPDLILCDIRDAHAVRTVFETIHPHVVFHAAAHKHVTLLERFPSEAEKTNVAGTQNVLDAAVSVGVETFVNISTDKAANPTSVLGETKRRAELLTARTQHEAMSGRYLSVRFGNVLGSSGSVIPTLYRQIEAGRPVTVTNAEATRYFMTIPEAVLLVVQAGALGEGGDVLVLDMGEPVSINDLAERLWRRVRPGTEPEIVYTGLRPGEKLHEVLVSDDDEPLPRPHARLRRYRVKVAPQEAAPAMPQRVDD